MRKKQRRNEDLYENKGILLIIYWTFIIWHESEQRYRSGRTDTNYRKYRDGILSDREISKTTKLKLSYQDLAYGRGMSTDANFQGIEYFTNLQDLEIDADELSQYSELGDEGCEMALDLKLDLSKNKKIKRFFCRKKTKKK